ncbi:MAG: hypothetical protein M3256_12675 [Actinomycetota bacterium]|nr:hypothetical protein [Actinomycetota bacterium]
MGKEHWKNAPDEHDYPAAADYLNLVLGVVPTQEIVANFRDASISHRKAKDLLRASELPLLAVDNKHVARDLAKVDRGEALSPILLVRGDLMSGRPLVVADGYHRICASYHRDENTDIPCLIVDPPANG